MAKYLIFDSGGLINITQNGLIDVFKKLAEEFQGEFLITETVKYETIEHPLKIKRFEWGALRIEKLLQDETIKMVEDEEIVDRQELEDKTGEVMNLVNSAFSSNGKPIHLIEKGEAESMALSLILTEKNIENMVVIDERTARMICEDIENLKELMESKLETRIEVNKDKLREFNDITVIRSTEIMYMANKNKLFDGDKKTMEAVLYALKYGGCSISEKEIEVMKKL